MSNDQSITNKVDEVNEHGTPNAPPGNNDSSMEESEFCVRLRPTVRVTSATPALPPRRPSSWDDSDDEPVSPSTHVINRKYRIYSADSRKSEGLIESEMKFQQAEEKKVKDVAGSNEPIADNPPENSDVKGKEEGTNRRQNPARVRRRTKSFNSSSPTIENRSCLNSSSNSPNSREPESQDFLQQKIVQSNTEEPESPRRELDLDSKVFLDNFFSELRVKRIGTVNNIETEKDGMAGDKSIDVLRLNNKEDDDMSHLDGSTPYDNDMYYCRTSRKLSQILEVEEVKKESEEKFEENVEREPLFDGGPLFHKNTQRIRDEDGEEEDDEDVSPLPTARSRHSDASNDIPSRKLFSVQKSLGLGNFRRLENGSVSDRCHNLFRSLDNDDIIYLTPKSAKTEIGLNREYSSFENETLQRFLQDYPITSSWIDNFIKENKMQDLQDLQESLKLDLKPQVSEDTSPRKSISNSARSTDAKGRNTPDSQSRYFPESPKFKLDLNQDSSRSFKPDQMKSSNSDRKTGESARNKRTNTVNSCSYHKKDNNVDTDNSFEKYPSGNLKAKDSKSSQSLPEKESTTSFRSEWINHENDKLPVVSCREREKHSSDPREGLTRLESHRTNPSSSVKESPIQTSNRLSGRNCQAPVENTSNRSEKSLRSCISQRSPSRGAHGKELNGDNEEGSEHSFRLSLEENPYTLGIPTSPVKISSRSTLNEADETEGANPKLTTPDRGDKINWQSDRTNEYYKHSSRSLGGASKKESREDNTKCHSDRYGGNLENLKSCKNATIKNPDYTETFQRKYLNRNISRSANSFANEGILKGKLEALSYREVENRNFNNSNLRESLLQSTLKASQSPKATEKISVECQIEESEGKAILSPKTPKTAEKATATERNTAEEITNLTPKNPSVENRKSDDENSNWLSSNKTEEKEELDHQDGNPREKLDCSSTTSTWRGSICDIKGGNSERDVVESYRSKRSSASARSSRSKTQMPENHCSAENVRNSEKELLMECPRTDRSKSSVGSEGPVISVRLQMKSDEGNLIDGGCTYRSLGGKSSKDHSRFASEKKRSFSVGNELWNDLIETFNNSENVYLDNKFPGYPKKKSTKDNEIVNSTAKDCNKDFYRHDNGGEDSFSESPRNIQNDKNVNSPRKDDEPISSSLENGPGTPRKQNPGNQLPKAFNTGVWQQNKEIYCVNVDRRGNLWIGEFGDTTCTLDEPELLHSDTPKDHGDGGQIGSENWNRYPLGDGRRKERHLWTEVSCNDTNTADLVLSIPVKANNIEANLEKFVIRCALDEIPTDPIPGQGESNLTKVSDAVHKEELTEPSSNAFTTDRRNSVDFQSKSTIRDSSSAESLKSSTTATDDLFEDCKIFKRLSTSLTNIHNLLEPGNPEKIQLKASSLSIADEKNTKRNLKDEKECPNWNIFLANNIADNKLIGANRWLLVGEEMKNDRFHKFKTKEKKNEKNLSREYLWKGNGYLANSNRQMVTPFKMRNTNCFQNFYKRIISLFCITAVSSTATSK